MFTNRWSRSPTRRMAGGGDPERPGVAPSLVVELYFYGIEEPMTIPQPSSDTRAAEAYFERIRSEVIDAQQHSRRRLTIRPPDPTEDSLVVDPSEIQRVVLADLRESRDAADRVARSEGRQPP